MQLDEAVALVGGDRFAARQALTRLRPCSWRPGLPVQPGSASGQKERAIAVIGPIDSREAAKGLGAVFAASGEPGHCRAGSHDGLCPE